MSLTRQFPETFADIARVCNVTFQWLVELEQSLENATPKSAEEIRRIFVSDVGDTLTGPHRMDVLEREGPPGSPKMATILIGEVHGNEGGCSNRDTKTIFRVLTEAITKTSNLFLILESFFHLIPDSAPHARRLSDAFQSKAANNKHSIWNACACISSGQEHCNVGNERVGQLIMFRAFSFIAQTIVTYLDGISVFDSVFHQLEKRIKHMDPREDCGMVPYEWIRQTNKEGVIKRMLIAARPKVLEFVPKLSRDDLCMWYTSNVREPLLTKIDDCIAQPTRDKYEFIFTAVTELVSMATHFSIMEKHVDMHPHIMVVVGDRHRELILSFLTACMKSKIKLVASYQASDSVSCLRFNRN